MRRPAHAFVLLTFFTVANAGEQSALQWKTFNEGILEAKKSKKKILIDVYTDWCGWCKKMDSGTYANNTVAAYLRARYVLVKLDAESAKKLSYKGKEFTERELSSAFGITGYPSTIFLKHDGEAITVYPGFADAKRFMDVASFIAEDHYLTTTFDVYVSGRK